MWHLELSLSSHVQQDGGGLRQGPITRAMFRQLEANKESEALVQIKMLTILSFGDSCKNCKK